MDTPDQAQATTPLRRLLSSASHTAVLVRNTAGSFGVKLLSNGLLFGAQVLFANRLGLNGFGIYILALAWINVLLLLARQGFDLATVRFVASYCAERRWDLLQGFLRSSTAIVIAGSVLTSGALVAICFVFRERFGEELFRAMMVAAAVVPVFALLQVKAAALRGFGHVVLGDVPHSIVHPALLLMLPVVCVPLFGFAESAENALAAYLVSLCVSLAVVWVLMLARVPTDARGATPSYRLREWVLTAPAMTLIAGFGIVLNQIGAILLGALGSPADAGLFGAAARVAWTLQLVVFALISAVGPMAARLHASNDMPGLQRAIAATGRLVFGLALVGAAILLAAGDWVLGWFGTEFRAGYTVMAILLVGQLAWAANAPAGVILNMTGRHNESALILGIGVAFDVALTAALVPYWGATGAAVANAATIVLWNLATAVGAYRWLGMRTWVRFGRPHAQGAEA